MNTLHEDDNDDDNGAEELEEFAISGKQYKVAKKPERMLISDLIDQNGLVDFYWYLQQYMQYTTQTYHEQVPFDNAQLIEPTLSIGVYKRAYISLPLMQQVSKYPIQETVRATPGRDAEGIRKAVPAKFDTVIAREYSPIGVGRGRQSATNGTLTWNFEWNKLLSSDEY